MTVSPTSVTYGSTGNTLIFTFTANIGDFGPGSQVALTIPAGWTPPTTAAGAGHITVDAGTATLSGNPPFAVTGSTIFVDMASCLAGQFFTVTYSGVTAPAMAGSPYTFTVQTDIGPGGEGLVNTTAAFPTVTVDPATLTVSDAGLTPDNKIYDGTTTATLVIGTPTLVGIVGADSVSLVTASATGTFADKDIGTAKIVTIDGLTLAGANAGNYLLTQPTRTADITKRPITVTAVTDTKTYDGTTSSIGVPTLSGGTPLAPGDTAPAWTQTFDNRNAGTGKSLTPAGAIIDGNNGLNYAYTFAPNTSGVITPKAITVTATTDSKIYDGTTSSGGVPILSAGTPLVAGDTAPAWTQAFDTKNVGTAKTLTPAGSVIDGNGGLNYAYNFIPVTTGAITQAALAVSAAGVNKVYDGTPTATVTLTDNRVSGDVLTTAYGSAAFANKAVGTGKPVSVSGITVTGADAGNYTYNATANTTANITQAALAVSAAGVNKVYDGTPTATVTLTDNRVSGDVLTTGYGSAAFADKAVGTGKPVSVSGITVTGTDAGNYTYNATANTTANITQAALAVSAAGVNKVYDGTPTATVTLTDNRVSGDVLTTGYGSAAFADKAVGTGKPVSVSGITVTGADAGNYTYNATANTTANITQAALAVSAAGVNKVYDGTPTATVTLTDNRVSGDVLTTAYGSAAFADKAVGTGKPVSVSGITVTGADAGNYTYNATANTTANITQAALAVSAAGVNKVYDGTPTATVTLTDNRVSGDVLTTAYGSAAFANKAVGTGKPVSVSGITVTGADAGNYTYNATANTTANITQAALAVSAAGVNKVYDGTPTATVTLTDNRVSGDVLTTAYGSAAFADKAVGTGKPVSVSGITVTGTDAGNYTYNATANTTANITQAALAVSAAGVNKVYDGTPTATVTLTDNRVSGDVLTTAYGSAAFANKAVGTGKPVSVSGITVTGADAGNYTYNATANTTANITQAALAVSAAGVNKVYDGTPTATVTLTDNRVSGDVLTTGLWERGLCGQGRGDGQAGERERDHRDRGRCGQLHLQRHGQYHGQHHPGALAGDSAGRQPSLWADQSGLHGEL